MSSLFKELKLSYAAMAVAAIVSRATRQDTGPETSSLNNFGGYTMFVFLVVNIVTNICLTAMIGLFIMDTGNTF